MLLGVVVVVVFVVTREVPFTECWLVKVFVPLLVALVAEIFELIEVVLTRRANVVFVPTVDVADVLVVIVVLTVDDTRVLLSVNLGKTGNGNLA